MEQSGKLSFMPIHCDEPQRRSNKKSNERHGCKQAKLMSQESRINLAVRPYDYSKIPNNPHEHIAKYRTQEYRRHPRKYFPSSQQIDLPGRKKKWQVYKRKKDKR